MAANGFDLSSFFTEREPSGPVSLYQTISAHPFCREFSHEEHRLKHYNLCQEETRSHLTNTSKLMATRQLSALEVAHLARPFRVAAEPIRTGMGDAHKFNGDAIAFLVGTEAPKRFVIHEALIKPRSEFVRLAMRGEWKEAQERTIPLPEDDPNVFSVYQSWLYIGLIHTRPKNTPSTPDGEYRTLVKAYILGEKFMDSNFKDSIADAIVEKLHSLRRFDTGLTDLVFENTPPQSPLRRLWLDAYYNFGSAEWLDARLVGDTVNTEFMVRFSQYQMRFRTGSSMFGPDAMFASCTYHEHGIRPCHRLRTHNKG